MRECRKDRVRESERQLENERVGERVRGSWRMREWERERVKESESGEFKVHT